VTHGGDPADTPASDPIRTGWTRRWKAGPARVVSGPVGAVGPWRTRNTGSGTRLAGAASAQDWAGKSVNRSRVSPPAPAAG